jgi:heme exporter protein C
MAWSIHTFANPTRFMRFSAIALPYVWALAGAGIGIGLYLSFFVAPPDYQQGDSVRIMFVHVPAAWLSQFGYGIMVASSIMALIFRHPLADVAAKSAAPIGAVFTFLALVAGGLWGKPMWGTYWVWDARTTSTLVLLFIYLGYMALWATIEDPNRAARVAAILALVGAVNLPIIRFSVDWWNTLHQPASVFRLDGPTIHSSLLWPLFVVAIGFTFFFLGVLMVRMRAEILRRKVRTLQMQQAAG